MVDSNSYLQPANADFASTPEGMERADLISTFEEQRVGLLRMVALRLDSRLAARVDPSDIVQEAFIRANRGFEEFQALQNAPLSAWLRMQTRYAIGDCHRNHLHTQKRAAGSEDNLYAGAQEGNNESICAPALELMAQSMISPSSLIAKQELVERVREVICQMPEADREILILRHVEEISINDTAMELGINVEAAKKRHMRALRRLQTLCQGLDESNAGKAQ